MFLQTPVALRRRNDVAGVLGGARMETAVPNSNGEARPWLTLEVIDGGSGRVGSRQGWSSDLVDGRGGQRSDGKDDRCCIGDDDGGGA